MEWTPKIRQNGLELLVFLTGSNKSPKGWRGTCQWENPEPLRPNSSDKLWRKCSVEPLDLLELPRRHNLSSSLVYHWKKQYARGKLNNESTQEEALLDRINKLERWGGNLTQKIRVFKKALQNTLKEQEKKESSLPLITPLSKVSKKGVRIDKNRPKHPLP